MGSIQQERLARRRKIHKEMHLAVSSGLLAFRSSQACYSWAAPSYRSKVFRILRRLLEAQALRWPFRRSSRMRLDSFGGIHILELYWLPFVSARWQFNRRPSA